MNWLCLPTDFNYTTAQLSDLTREGIADELYKRGMDILTAKEAKYGRPHHAGTGAHLPAAQRGLQVDGAH